MSKKNKKQDSEELINAAPAEDISAEDTQETAPEAAPAEENAPEADKKKKEKYVDPAKAAEKAEKKKYSRRKLKYGGAATAVTLIVIAVVVLVNVVLSVLSDRMNMSIDITPDGTFEISQETIDYLATVD
ncbi:MAG: hypothetical protein ACI4XF_09605, partial [Oscillospiraceae bacterium]